MHFEVKKKRIAAAGKSEAFSLLTWKIEKKLHYLHSKCKSPFYPNLNIEYLKSKYCSVSIIGVLSVVLTKLKNLKNLKIEIKVIFT